MKGASNKMVSNSDLQDFHFAGTGIRPPMNIRAKTYDEAFAIYNQKMEKATEPEPDLGSYEE